MANAYTSNAA